MRISAKRANALANAIVNYGIGVRKLDGREDHRLWFKMMDEQLAKAGLPSWDEINDLAQVYRNQKRGRQSYDRV